MCKRIWLVVVLTPAFLLSSIFIFSCKNRSEEKSDLTDLAFDRNEKNIALLFAAPTNLSGPPHDLEKLGPLMEKFGFKTVSLNKATKADILEYSEQYASQVSDNGTLWWYFSGHGGRTGLLQTEDYKGLAFSEVASVIKSARNIPIKRLLVVVDSCFSGQLANGDVAIITNNGAVTSTDSKAAEINSELAEESEFFADETATEEYLASKEFNINFSNELNSASTRSSLYNQAMVFSSSKSTEESADLGNLGGAFSYALGNTISDLRQQGGKPTIRDLVDDTIERTREVAHKSHTPVYRVFPSIGVLDDYLFQPGSNLNLMEDENISYSEAGMIRVVLKNEAAAKEFFDKMNIAAKWNSDKYVKTFENIGEPGSIKISLACYQSINRPYHGCDLTIDNKQVSGRRAYKYHRAIDDNNIFILRNDTDYSEPVKPIFNLFKDVSLKNVNSIKDQQIGWQIIGGKEFSIPETEDSPFKLSCRNDKDQYFCKFQVKLPH